MLLMYNKYSKMFTKVSSMLFLTWFFLQKNDQQNRCLPSLASQNRSQVIIQLVISNKGNGLISESGIFKAPVMQFDIYFISPS